MDPEMDSLEVKSVLREETSLTKVDKVHGLTIEKGANCFGSYRRWAFMELKET